MRNPLLRKSLALFLGRLILVYVLLTIPWPGFTQLYTSAFRSVAEAVFTGENEQRTISFEQPPENMPHHEDTRIVIVNNALMKPDGSGPVRNVDFRAANTGWKPAALFIALVLATPLPWQRRRRALLLGILSIYGFILATLAFSIWTESAEIALVTLTPFWKGVANALQDQMLSGISFFIPVVVWVFLTFRREDTLANIAIFATTSE